MLEEEGVIETHAFDRTICLANNTSNLADSTSIFIYRLYKRVTILSHLYIIHASGTSNFKIGKSINPHKRLKQLQTGCPYKLELVCVLENMGNIEKPLHRKLERFRCRKMKGEWFKEEALPFLPDEIYQHIKLE